MRMLAKSQPRFPGWPTSCMKTAGQVISSLKFELRPVFEGDRIRTNFAQNV